MRAHKKKSKSASSDDAPSVRASISFPQDLYQTLEEIARQRKVSLAWIVRDAAAQYIADKWPLFRGRV
jgi:metal-responsive CopG/Arc/MetJ family transcriptional regulator